MVKRKKRKVEMPISSAGLIRYMDQEGRGIKIKPEHVVYAALGVVIFGALLRVGWI